MCGVFGGGEVCCTKAFKFILVIFVSISITLGDRSKKTLLRFMSNSVVPMISSRSLDLMHFVFIFACSARECSNFHLNISCFYI